MGDLAGDAWAPRALIVSLYGLYARDRGGWLSVASIVALMGDLGVDQQAVRSAILRLKKRGLLEAEKSGRVAGYRLTDASESVIAEADARIAERPRATPDAGWLLVVFSVPEAERDRRHRLRATLTHLGLGTVGPGIWVAPPHLGDVVEAALTREDLRGFVDLFRAGHLGERPPAELVADWWDLDALAGTYERFLTQVEPLRTRWRARNAAEEPARAFVDWVLAVTVWRHLASVDPGLPLDALPADWAGARAEDLLSELRLMLAGPATKHVEAVTGSG